MPGWCGAAKPYGEAPNGTNAGYARCGKLAATQAAKESVAVVARKTKRRAAAAAGAVDAMAACGICVECFEDELE